MTIPHQSLKWSPRSYGRDLAHICEPQESLFHVVRLTDDIFYVEINNNRVQKFEIKIVRCGWRSRSLVPSSHGNHCCKERNEEARP